MKNKIVLTILVAAIALSGAVGFYSGMTWEKGKISAAQSDRQARFGEAGGQFVARGATGRVRTQALGVGGGFAVGEVLAKDDKSLTLKLRDGGSKIVFFTGATPITKTAPGTPEEIAVGKNVMVNGTANPDGSMSAQSIQISPAFSQRNDVSSVER